MRSNQAGVKAPFISAPASAAKIAARKLERPDEWGNRLMREHAQAALDKREEKDWDRERAKWLADLLAPVRAERLEKAKTAIADLFKELKKNPQFTIPYDLWLGLEPYHGNRDAKIVHRAATQPARELEAMRKAIRLQNAVGVRQVSCRGLSTVPRHIHAALNDGKSGGIHRRVDVGLRPKRCHGPQRTSGCRVKPNVEHDGLPYELRIGEIVAQADAASGAA